MDAANELISFLLASGTHWSFAWDALWTGGLAATLLAIIVALLTRSNRMRPATRHALWAAVVVSFATPLLTAGFGRPVLFRVEDLLRTPPALATSVEAPWSSSSLLKESTRLAEPLARDTTPHTAPAAVSTVHSALDGNDVQLAEHFSVNQLSLDAERLQHVACIASTTPTFDVVASQPTATAAANTKPGTADTVTPKAAPAASPTVKTASPFEVRLWLARVLAVRDALAALPPLPIAVWLAGVLALVSLQFARLLALRRLVRRADLAPACVQREVADAAAAIGLDRIPQTRMTQSRISPLVWCGVRAKLVLPVDLWATLDAPSRRAVLLHELAHIRRGDHRMCWLDSAIGIVYWWHPIAWWARHRLRDAAEASCDAWVTSLCPSSRRKYAEALVLATSFLTSSNGRSPLNVGSVGVGFVSGRTRKLARRITMVMTHRNAPRMSLVGTGAAILAIGFGAFVTPSLACPPEKDEAVAAGGRAIKSDRSKARTRTVAPLNATESDSSPFLGEAPAIEAMTTVSPSSANEALRSLNALQLVRPALPPTRLRVLSGANVDGDPLVNLAIADAARVAPRSIGSAAVVAGNAETTVRVYALPEGKLDALVELMSRQDVPIFIEHRGNAIAVHATPGQHEIFAAFVQMIHPSNKWRSSAGGMDDQGLAAQALAEAQASYQARGAAPRNFGVRSEAMARARDAELRAAQRQLEGLGRSRDAMEAEVERLRDAAEQARERADKLREALEQLESQRGQADDETVEQALLSAVRSVQNRYERIEAEATAGEGRVEGLEQRLEEIDSMISEAEGRLESLSEQLAEADAMGNEDSQFEITEPAYLPLPFKAIDVFAAPTTVSPVAPVAPIAPIAPAAPAPASR